MDFLLMQKGQEDSVIEVVKEVFDDVIAPGYTRQGIDEFYRFASATRLAERSGKNSFTIFARDDDTIPGIIEIRDLNHVAMFFVRRRFQNRGIGKALFKAALKEIENRDPDIEKITVNSSLNAVPAYERIGFSAEDGEQCVNGIVFVPMMLSLNPSSTE